MSKRKPKPDAADFFDPAPAARAISEEMFEILATIARTSEDDQAKTVAAATLLGLGITPTIH